MSPAAPGRPSRPAPSAADGEDAQPLCEIRARHRRVSLDRRVGSGATTRRGYERPSTPRLLEVPSGVPVLFERR
jgi:hypothetical protein